MRPGLPITLKGSVRKLVSPTYWAQKVYEAFLDATVPAHEVAAKGYLQPIEEKCLYRSARSVRSGGTIVEVGSYYGRSASLMGLGVRDSGRSARICCVDTWQNTAVPDAPADIYDTFLSNVEPFRDLVTPLRGRSEEVAASWSGPIDLLFIDGDHSFEGCRRDIECWVPFVRSGGWILFHDTDFPDVRRAIDSCDHLLPRRPRLRAWSILLVRKR